MPTAGVGSNVRPHTGFRRNFAVHAPSSDAEFYKLVEGAEKGKLIVIDWTATWCGKYTWLQILAWIMRYSLKHIVIHECK